jgi:hypothetical protein
MIGEVFDIKEKPQLQADFQDFAQFSLQALSIPAKCQIAKDFFCNKVQSSF